MPRSRSLSRFCRRSCSYELLVSLIYLCVEKIGDDRLSAQEMKRRNPSWLAKVAICAALLLCVRVAPAQDTGDTDEKGAAKLRVIHTKHYEIHTDLDTALVVELSERMDVMYEQYVAAMSEF